MTDAEYVCDGCMGYLTADEVADFADGEHVLCLDCEEEMWEEDSDG